MAKPPYLVPSHLDVEQNVGPIKDVIEHTNSLVMENHGVTTLGRTVPRQLLGAEHLGAAHGVAEAVATLRA